MHFVIIISFLNVMIQIVYTDLFLNFGCVIPFVWQVKTVKSFSYLSKIDYSIVYSSCCLNWIADKYSHSGVFETIWSFRLPLEVHKGETVGWSGICSLHLLLISISQVVGYRTNQFTEVLQNKLIWKFMVLLFDTSN